LFVPVYIHDSRERERVRVCAKSSWKIEVNIVDETSVFLNKQGRETHDVTIISTMVNIDVGLLRSFLLSLYVVAEKLQLS
jgi:hypothetical protein